LAPIQNFFPPDVLKLLEPAADAESVCAFENKTGAVRKKKINKQLISREFDWFISSF
jgi:hypothetical protein